MTNALSYALLAFIAAVIAAVFGFGAPFEAIVHVSRVAFFVAIGLFIVLLIAGLTHCRCLKCLAGYSKHDKSQGGEETL